ncbi:MAG: hypothetical protein ACXVAY_00845 [Mucilaginibacter sp.]
MTARYFTVFLPFGLLIILIGCKPKPAPESTDMASVLAHMPPVVPDNRPKDELYFLNRVKAEADYELSQNAVQKDMHIDAFNKYAKDSLKKIVNWEMIVTEINDNEFAANSVAKTLFGNNVYNVELVAPIKFDKSVDTIAIDNRVDFTLTIPKKPKGDLVKAQLSTIQTLKKGDTVIVSGALTHLDDQSKVNFAEFYEHYQPWNIDLLQTEIHKKGNK